MAALARYPDAQSPYWIEHRSGLYRVHHEREGLIAECDCLGEARNQISDAEDEAEALAAAEAREIAEATAATDRFDALDVFAADAECFEDDAAIAAAEARLIAKAHDRGADILAALDRRAA